MRGALRVSWWNHPVGEGSGGERVVGIDRRNCRACCGGGVGGAAPAGGVRSIVLTRLAGRLSVRPSSVHAFTTHRRRRHSRRSRALSPIARALCPSLHPFVRPTDLWHFHESTDRWPTAWLAPCDHWPPGLSHQKCFLHEKSARGEIITELICRPLIKTSSAP